MNSCYKIAMVSSVNHNITYLSNKCFVNHCFHNKESERPIIQVEDASHQVNPKPKARKIWHPPANVVHIKIVHYSNMFTTSINKASMLLFL